MNSNIPNPIKIYHIVHVDKLPTILAESNLVCDSEMQRRQQAGTTIGMDKIKKRRLQSVFSSYPDLHVGDCVPFYFCPRSVMLYVIARGNHVELAYRDGQEPIVHLVADMHKVWLWAMQNHLRCIFTSSGAGSYYFDAYTCENDLDKINWDAIRTHDWKNCREEKQAEFLIEQRFPWELVERIGVYSQMQYRQVTCALAGAAHHPPIEIKQDWYY